MGERQSIRITVLDTEQCDGDWPPETAAEFMAWWQSMIDRIPEEHRSEARIEIDTTAGYDRDFAHLEIYYLRPETDEERAARVQAEQARAEAREAQERARYEALKAKFAS